MKTLKSVLAIVIFSLFVCTGTWAQQIKTEMILTIDHLDYGPEIGIVTGSYSYGVNLKLSKSGTIEKMHWNVKSCDLVNDRGEAVRVIDSGMDNYGVMWIFFNYLNAINEGYPIWSNQEDGWLDDIMPSEMPSEGTIANMSAKVMVKGKIYYLGGLLQLHMDANGVVRADVTKGFFAL